jgi:hypothetical protein
VKRDTTLAERRKVVVSLFVFGRGSLYAKVSILAYLSVACDFASLFGRWQVSVQLLNASLIGAFGSDWHYFETLRPNFLENFFGGGA